VELTWKEQRSAGILDSRPPRRGLGCLRVVEFDRRNDEHELILNVVYLGLRVFLL
jgi:hypothetical protein